ncbi:MAG: cyclomaltodextrinase C-terminal domain-containing protein, partial [Kangiellaceae bacterium]|nr:cyclomaltodextrinase C-terminal domain-containing protein [Kangiellaceae bacterium]
WQKGALRKNNYKSDLRSLMDFPLQDSIVRSLTEKESWSDGLQKLYATLASDFIYAKPEELMTFVDNHDMSRVATQLNNDPELIKMALAILLTTRGVPQIFYGTEVAMHNNGTDSHGVIRTEFPGGWSEHPDSAFTGEGIDEKKLEIQSYLKRLLNWRKKSKAITQGTLKHYAPKEGVYVYFRVFDADDGDNENQKVMIVVNKNKEIVSIVPKSYPSMLGKEIKAKVKAKNIFTSEVFELTKSIEVSSRSVSIFEIE